MHKPVATHEEADYRDTNTPAEAHRSIQAIWAGRCKELQPNSPQCIFNAGGEGESGTDESRLFGHELFVKRDQYREQKKRNRVHLCQVAHD